MTAVGTQSRVDSEVHPTAESRVSIRGLRRAAPIVVPKVLWILLVMFALYASSRAVWYWISVDAIGFDFDGTLWSPAIDIREGRSPFPRPQAVEVDVNNPAVYPPLLPMLVIPLTLLPVSVAVLLWAALLGGAVALALYALDVRDPRCYFAAFISAPIVTGVGLGNATMLLVPLIALAWRWRSRAIVCGSSLGLAIAAKLFLAPLLLWLLGTRRYRAAGVAVLTATLAVFLPWAVIGFDGLREYPDLLRLASETFGPHSTSLATILSALGAQTWVAIYAASVAGLTFGALSFVAGRRATDEASMAIAVMAAIFLSPIVWEYYYALVLIPLAVAWPRFSVAWIAMPLFCISSGLPRPMLSQSDIDVGGIACCPPDGVPDLFWASTHAPPGLWPALGHALIALALVTVIVFFTPRGVTRSQVAPRGHG